MIPYSALILVFTYKIIYSVSGFHASQETTGVPNKTVGSMLPIFYEKSATPAMMKHSLQIVKDLTEHLNPGQIPVIAADQPLYAEIKYIQWALPDIFGTNKMVAIMGGLHIEMSLWRCMGDILGNSGWTTLITEAEVASSGVTNSFLKCSHLTRTRNAHKVTFLSLYVLQLEAYARSGADLPYEEWQEHMRQCSATFFYWDLVMQLETKIFSFIRSQRSKNFALYVRTLEELVFLYFSLNHQNYARWLSVHLHDLKTLPESIFNEFCGGNFVTSKTQNRFSAMPYDQRHEQNNKEAKVKCKPNCYFL